ncbi:S8 family serine peptidase [Mesorhizobium sp. LHD-90]|uniref:S8 family serine peptidase n=1 Tax=Mesorhizobium sp. LHD-90 TaxID=3071414 RepID=UPI0027E1F50F|nr:S8 family serine peptidase [Mesorhizobium sp. LHD-90]MDQ6436938.1 S8 family serine peptidase [Mesorhizobium sp. LHD-90]
MPSNSDLEASRAYLVASTMESDPAAVAVLAAPPTVFRAKVDIQLDPRLQRVIARRELGIRQAASASAEVDEVAVIAKVTSYAEWEALSEVRASMEIGPTETGDTIVTGRIPAQRIESVRSRGFVKSLKAGQRLAPALAAGVEETGAAPASLPAGAMANGGAGVVVGIVDYGCDFAHRNFLSASGSTRLLSIWKQDRSSGMSAAVPYGREFTRAEIDAALRQADPYSALGYGPGLDTPFSTGTHGTHVMDIAAGNGNGSGAAGFAPNADLVFVDVAHDDIAFFGPEVVGSRFGDSAQLLEAIKYIVTKADGRPCVVNISLGTNGGPHDGTTLVEEGIDSLVSGAPDRAVTIAASNSYDDGIHYAGRVAAGDTHDIVWRVPFGNVSHGEFELWYPGADRISLELIAPGGNGLVTVSPGNNASATGAAGGIEIFAANRLDDPNNGDNMINVFLERTASGGDWTLRLHGDAITDGSFHAWIERDNRSQSAFAPPHDNTHTVGSISCGKLAIVVGSYDAHKPSRPISWFSSAGPTRDGREKPELSGPGHAVVAAHSRTRTGTTLKSGTSMAAPAVAGIVALMFAEARSRGLQLDIRQVRDILVRTARRNPPPGTAWDDRYGAGRVDAAAALREVIALSPGPAVAAVAAPAATTTAAKPKKARRARKKTA